MPACYFAVLLRYCSKINPPSTERLSALQLRSADLSLRPISFLYATYTPEAYMFEVRLCPSRRSLITDRCGLQIFDSYRRIVMQGLLTFASLKGWETGDNTRLAQCSRLTPRN